MIVQFKTRQYFDGDGRQKVYSIPFDYLKPEFIKARVDDEIALTNSIDFTVSGRTVVFRVAPYGKLCIYRETPTGRIVDWVDGSVFKANDLNAVDAQVLHILEEMQDKLNEGMDELQSFTASRMIQLAPSLQVTAGQLLGYRSGGYVLAHNTDYTTLESVVLAVSDSVNGICDVIDYGYFSVSGVADGVSCFVGEKGEVMYTPPVQSGRFVKRLGFVEGGRIRFRPDSLAIRLR